MANFILINSFDRSGSTLLAKSLAAHQKIECLYSPFNASVFRREYMKIWDDKLNPDVHLEGYNYVKNIVEGNINKETIKSAVFYEQSSTFKIIKRKYYIIKATTLHLKLNWFNKNFSHIETYGLIRYPLGILASLVRNNYHIDWYGGWAYEQIMDLIRKQGLYNNEEKRFLCSLTDEIEKMAAIIGVLNSYMLRQLPPENIIIYEQMIKEPNRVLNGFTSRFGLSYYDYSPLFKKSVNATGKDFRGMNVYREIFTKKEINRYISILNTCGNLGYELKG